MDDDGDVLAARPTPLVEVRPQPGVLRHSAEQVIETFVPVQVLDAPVPQMGEVQVVEFMRKFVAPVVAEPVIEVPKILLDGAPQRLGDHLRQPQMVEQLVHVPTVVSYSSLLQLTAQQIVDMPASGAGGEGRGGLQGSLPRQNSALHVEQTVDIPVPGRAGGGERGGLQGFSGQGSTASSGADRVDIPVPRSGGLQGSRPGQGSSSSSRLLENTDAGIQWVFRTFPRGQKSAGFGPHSGSELGADFTPWTPAAYAESMVFDDDESEEESESEVEVEEGAVTRFAAGFRPLRVCMRFLEHQMGRPVWGCAYGDRCTFAHSWAELHPEDSAHERELASYFPD